jgi:ABC-type sulfate/molybdate transport systems ATPase subunit
MSALLAVQALSVSFGARDGLRGLTFAAGVRECVAVLGVSGSGKSSLLRTLAGLQPAAHGRVMVDGRDVTTLPPEQRRMVYLHQEPVLFPTRTVLENVAFPLEIRGASTRDAAARAQAWLERLQVAELASRMPTALSGGQKHRVALARALCAEPQVLLLDEPLAALDPAVRADVRDALIAAREASGAAMVLVTHDLDDALAVADRIVTLERGTQTANATPAALLDAPPALSTARLLGLYGEIRGTIRDGTFGSTFLWAAGDMQVEASHTGDTIACVRAHHVHVTLADARDAHACVVTARRDGAHTTWLTLRTASDGVVRLPAPLATVARVGDHVRVTLSALIPFPAPRDV